MGQELGRRQGSTALVYHGRAIDAKKIKKATSRYRGLVPQQGSYSPAFRKSYPDILTRGFGALGPLSPGFELADTAVTVAPVLQSVLKAQLPLMRLTPSLFVLKQYYTFQSKWTRLSLIDD